MRIANCKCQSSSSIIFNIEIRQPKEYLLVLLLVIQMLGEREGGGRPDHIRAFQRAICMRKAPEASGARFFNQPAFFYLQITLPILIISKLKHTRDCTSRTVWQVVWFEAIASKTNHSHFLKIYFKKTSPHEIAELKEYLLFNIKISQWMIHLN